jgi:probable HAF family extracellular repeat protein
MRFRPLLVAVAAITAACDSDPTAPHIPTASPLTRPALSAASYVATWNHAVLPLPPNVQANLATAFGQAINETGSVAGYIEGPFDGNWFTVSRAMLWTTAGVQNLGVLPPGSPSQRSYATDLNDGGMVTGWGTTHSSTGLCCGVVRGFRWTSAGGMQPLVPPSPSDYVLTRGYAINTHGHVAGMVTDAAGAFHAAVWTDPGVAPVVIGSLTDATAYDINDAGQVVGAHSGGAFIWSAQNGVTVLPTLGGAWTYASGINNQGVVVGMSELADGTQRPFRWTAAGGMENLGLPPGATYGSARAITETGRIIVTADFVDAATGDVTSRLFLLADGQWIDLGPAGFGSTYAGGINETLQIAGSGQTGQTAGLDAIRWDVTLTPATPAFTLDGFFAPIQNLPVVNLAKAGQGIPVKFSLGGNMGLNIFAPGFPTSHQMACDGSAPIDEVESTVSAGGSSLSFDTSTGVYTYVWKTEKSWAGTCRSLTVRLTDGTDRSAHFRFVR